MIDLPIRFQSKGSSYNSKLRLEFSDGTLVNVTLTRIR